MRLIIHRRPDGVETVLGKTRLNFISLRGARGWDVAGAKADKVFNKAMASGDAFDGLFCCFTEHFDVTGRGRGVVGIRKEPV